MLDKFDIINLASQILEKPVDEEIMCNYQLDSLEQVAILVAIDNLLSGKVSHLPGIAEAITLAKIIDELASNNLIASFKGRLCGR